MLCGKRPFSGRNSMDVLRQKGAKEAPRVDSIDRTIPGPHADVIAKCLARTPEGRPESMRHLELELMRAQELTERGWSGESSGVSPLPPPPVAGTLLAPPPPVATPVPDPAPVSAAKPSPARAPSGATSGAAANMAAKQAAVPAAATSTSGLPKSFSEPEVAADRAGRSIVPIALLGAIAAAVVLFVWPGMLRERTKEPIQAPVATAGVSAGATTPVAASSAEVTSGTSASVGTAPTTTGGTTAGAEAETVAAAATADPTAAGVPEPGEPDLVLLVGKLELAAAEDRWRHPADDNVALHMAKIEALDPSHESIARIQAKAVETLKARAEIAAGEKRWHDAVESYRDLYGISPDYKNKKAKKGFTEALKQEAKILHFVKDPEQMILVADDLLSLDSKSYEGHFMRAEALEAQSKWRESADSYAIAKKLRPKEKEASDGFKRAEKQAKAAGL